MAGFKPYTDEQLKDAVRILHENDYNQTKAAVSANMPRGTFQGRIRQAEARGMLSRRPRYLETEITMPDLPPSELPPEQIVEQAALRYKHHEAAKEARRWMEIKVRSNKPIGIAFVGDPHIDSGGCNWPLLDRDIKLLRDTPGLYACNMGDLTDNWVGRLVRLYADQEMSKKAAWKLAKWFMNDAGIKWLVHILGNHDMWNDGPYLIKANAVPTVPVEEWQSRFKVVFPNGQFVKVHASHDFPGSSIWNDLHGAQKASMLFEEANLFVCGHKHNWAIKESENAQRNFIYWLVRCRGYKFIDSYGDQLGHGSQKYGATVTAIIDPSTDGVKYIRCFPDLQEAAEFLTWKRERA